MKIRWRTRFGTSCAAVDCIHDTATEKIDNIERKIQKWSEIGSKCRTISYETIEICKQTQLQRKAMIDFASEIQSTLESSGFGLSSTSASSTSASPSSNNIVANSSTLSTIREMTSGDKVRAAMDIATGLADIGNKCLQKSTELNELMEEAVEEIPRFLKNSVTKREIIDDDDDNDNDDNIDDDREEELVRGGGKTKNSTIIISRGRKNEVTELLQSINKDVNDIELCIHEIQHFNIQNALKVGVQAFVQLTEKTKRIGILFDSMETFANHVYIVTHTFNREHLLHTNPFVTVKQFAKSIMGIIHSNEIIKLVSDAVTQLLKITIHLFEVTACNVSKLWSSISYAKDCMDTCRKYIQHAKDVCTKAILSTSTLIGKSRTVSTNLQAACELDMKAIWNLAVDGEIHNAIVLATTIDDEIMICTNEIIKMIDRVNDSFNELPILLTATVDRSISGNFKHCIVPDIEDDINEIISSNRCLEEGTDFISTPRSGILGFHDIALKSEKCLDRLRNLEVYATTCETTIVSFLSVWDIESTSTKINDMCRMVSIGEYMKTIAHQIQRLVEVILLYMKTFIKKCSTHPHHHHYHNYILPNKIKIGSNHNNNNNNNIHINDNGPQQQISNLIDTMKDTFKFF